MSPGKKTIRRHFFIVMPRKPGSKNKKPAIGRQKLGRPPISQEAYTLLERTAREMGYINPRNGEGDRSALLEKMIRDKAVTFKNVLGIIQFLDFLRKQRGIPIDIRAEAREWLARLNEGIK